MHSGAVTGTQQVSLSTDGVKRLKATNTSRRRNQPCPTDPQKLGVIRNPTHLQRHPTIQDGLWLTAKNLSLSCEGWEQEPGRWRPRSVLTHGEERAPRLGIGHPKPLSQCSSASCTLHLSLFPRDDKKHLGPAQRCRLWS